MHWHKLRVEAPDRAPIELIHRTFDPIFEAIGRPADMAIFLREFGLGRGIFYFAPGADGFARTIHAVPCERPPRKNLSLIAGDGESWTLFSD